MDNNLRCIVVTPERSVLDQTADFVAVPMYDGELGVLPGRSPLIGRLGAGELRMMQGGHPHRYFVDGGFVQIRSNTVTVLTPKAVPAEEIDAKAAERDLQTAQTKLTTTKEDQDAQFKAQARARAMLRVARHRHGPDFE